ncbi:hypothetical protein OJ996_20940 [Luteolibacter sp. GHJ8]|uniref:Secreted protein n=1 Tax=Luteolibacter rhizosphaerae TaxID=2989719 RepID=A0ABT3G899_9BACT|nr:hypothetical protein [Luteolibacter rhizosphaerae]MCW1916068.1 hypothetical protein [Luteolibacter rhizosphaerae]
MKILPLFTSLYLCCAVSAFAAPLYIFSGQGVTVVVLEADKDETHVSGEIRFGGGIHPFTATVRETEDAGTVDGHFTVDGVAKRFRATLDEDEETASLSMEGKSYQLAAVDAVPEMKPRKEEPAQDPPGESLQAALRLKRVNFPDVSMGGVAAYSMLVPESWNSQGKIEWPPVDDPYPQASIQVKGPGREKITILPAQHFSYLESANMPPQGNPSPQDIGQWLVATIRRTNPAVSAVELLSNKRHPEAEANARKNLNPGIENTIHTLTISYREEGVAMMEEIHLSYARYPPVGTQHVRSLNWSVFIVLCAAAPADDFDRVKSQVYAYANTLAPLPRWWNQMTQVRQQIINLRGQRIAEEIRRRGEFYNDMSDRQHAAFMQRMRSDDEVQRRRIQGIREVQDYQDSDGSRVELPFHYKHVFSDGKGNYHLSNTYQKPGESFQEIQAAE